MAAEITQLVKSFPYKHKGLVLILQTHVTNKQTNKRAKCDGNACNSSAVGSWNLQFLCWVVELWCILANQLCLLNHVWANKKLCFKKWEMVLNKRQLRFPSLASSCVCVSHTGVPHTCTHRPMF